MHEIIKNILSIKAPILSPELENLKDILAEAQIEDFKEYILCAQEGSSKLTFNKVNELNWPSWLPNYVQKLYGISRFSHDHIGSYAEAFNGEESKESKEGKDGDKDQKESSINSRLGSSNNISTGAPTLSPSRSNKNAKNKTPPS